MTPIKKKQFVQNNYWELVSSAAKKMDWKDSEIKRRREGNSLFKSQDCNKAKAMLEIFHDMDEDFVKVGKPNSIENEDQLIFIKALHLKIVSNDKTVKTVKKNSKLVQPSRSIKDMFKK